MKLITASVLTALLTSFVATRTVQATPLNRQEYNDLRGWQVPDNENPNDNGYLVVNAGVSERNVDGFDGYVSWLPKLAFEEQYKNDNLTFGQAVELLKGGKKSLVKVGMARVCICCLLPTLILRLRLICQICRMKMAN
ncbi:hypothetical protein EJK51_1000 [Moraxella catarrhalis]|uniref:hypothetical protein n=1 Tax=Moraxella catarrhalis TaxID=480 RepID=UPI000AC1FB4D|nr:hypothetical protein [Moraxella catarrhalis]AZQ86472.1 hypothetical protein EJK52_1002 [Moraxella catarrhalis]AZQ91292.1 hypothetical protein EJK51_1000 [Moraxella catarrhalis]